MGIERRRRRDPIRARPLEVWLAGLLLNFSSRVLPVTQAIAERWGRLAVPDPLPVVDGLITATAIEHGLTLVTRNVADMERTGVTILDPFSGPG
jgi:toxin FitB